MALRGRALIRLGRAAETVDSFAEVSRDLAHAEQGESYAVRAAAQVALGLTDDAEASLVEARAHVFPAGIPALEAEVQYTSALLAWTTGDFTKTFSGLEMVLAVESRMEPFLRSETVDASAYPLPLEYWRGRAYELRGMTEAMGERFHDQAHWMTQALKELERGDVRDRYVEAAMMFNASVLVRDLDVPALADFVAGRAEKFEWNEATRSFEFSVFHVLGRRRALDGDHLGALRCFRRSADRAPSIPTRMLAILDRSRLTRHLGENTTSDEELDYAVRLASQTNWEATDARERTALLFLAEQLVATDLKRARILFDRYSAIRLPISKLELGAHNRRQFADDCFVEAQILRAEGQTSRATLLFIEAFDIWSQIGYERARACAAIELAELTRETRFIDIAHDEVTRYPHSSFARRFRTSLEALSETAAAL